MKFIESFESYNSKKISLSGKTINVELATTPNKIKRGYMFSKGPREDEGMLFIFPKSQKLSFWMKNVSVPLDILFFDSNKKLINTHQMAPQKDGEEIKNYDSETESKYALELKSGWIDKYLDFENSDLIFEI